jgi:hypothetical protein
MERRRLTDELLEEIQEGQRKLLEEIAKPESQHPVEILLKFSAYLVPLIVAVFTILNIIKTSELEIAHIRTKQIELSAKVSDVEKECESMKIWNREVQLTMQNNQKQIDTLRSEMKHLHSKTFNPGPESSK